MLVTAMETRAQIDLESSFEALYWAESAAVLRYLRAATAGSGDAEDLCAETFFRAWRAWPKFQPGQAPPRAWLLRIARNLARNRYRSGHHLRLLTEDDPPDTDRTNVTVLRLDLEAAVARLRWSDRELVAMRSAGLSHAEVARVQGRSEDAVKMAWGRLLRHLRAELEDN